MALPPTTANWHWKNKNVTNWGREWFKQELVKISAAADSGKEVVAISKVTLFDGDVELGQRKSKLITIYDCKLEADWSGTASDGSEVNGRLVIPEVSHEMTDGLSDYEFNWSLTTARSADSEAVLNLAKTRLTALLTAKMSEFPIAIREVHGKDITVSGDPSRAGTPVAGASQGAKPATTPSQAPAPAAPKPQKPVNTTTVKAEASFMAAADDLFGLLTDEKRIPIWSRAPAKSPAQPGAAYSIFGGGVEGEYVSLTPGKEIVQTWVLRSPTWPTGHKATLTTTFEQASDSTKVTLSLANVPTGLEDEIKRNIEGYYIHGLKSIGLGTVL